MPPSLVPDAVLRDIFEIDVEGLAMRGITLMLADLDNTLAPYGEDEPGARLRQWALRIRENGIDLFILSNSRRPARAERFAELLGVPCIGRAGKPRAAAFVRAMEQMGRRPEETVMVGDQMFTDVLGAKNAGIRVIAVRPITFGNPFRVFRYGLELPFRAMSKRRTL